MTDISTERDVLEVFLDTSAHVAIEDLDDVNHKKAMEFREQIRLGGTPFRRLYTSNYVIDETHTYAIPLRDRCGGSLQKGARI